MERNATADLWAWYKKKIRQPLIIRGARQVGKSTLVHLFCEKYKLSLIEINLEKIKLSTVLKLDFEIESLLDEIQLKAKQKISKNTIIFFDEIQESPRLLKFLRYFYEERPDLAIISAGSLLEIAMKDEEFSFPVGRIEFYHLGPMSFSEFLLATNNDFLLEKIHRQDFSEAVVNEAKKQLRDFYYVGGMPRAVKTFVQEKSLVSVRSIQEQILQTYIADFPKYNARINTNRVEKIFYSSVSHLGKKMIYTKLTDEGSSRDIRKALELLIDAKVLLKCTHSNANSVPLAGEIDERIFKVYFLDIGLVTAMMGVDLDIIDQEMKNNFSMKGALAEQFVAQHLAYLSNQYRGPELFYWLKDKGSQKGEIDFLVQKKDKIIPIEVKASATGHLKSLFYFAHEKNKKKAIKVSLDNFSKESASHRIKNTKREIELTSLPQYAIENLYKILD